VVRRVSALRPARWGQPVSAPVASVLANLTAGTLEPNHRLRVPSWSSIRPGSCGCFRGACASERALRPACRSRRRGSDALTVAGHQIKPYLPDARLPVPSGLFYVGCSSCSASSLLMGWLWLLDISVEPCESPPSLVLGSRWHGFHDAARFSIRAALLFSDSFSESSCCLSYPRTRRLSYASNTGH
jgi:hypothetical protein